ncbi:MAG: adenosylcobinamide-GDP ribazoletransferase [Synergistaceae bacterium]|jgi:adenosylcobinamide-GDP ribazoletransferase|nr:adenosylcobinamide-GDP ribazoletransferase [Synergistaceae bacterium]
MSIITAAAIAFAFLTILPAPRVEWTKPRLRYFPVVLPLVGAVVGLMGTGLFAGLRGWRVSPPLRGALMTLFYLCLTGGIHMDGFMDTCDAVFSRQNREERLRILSDTHTGAFAVIGCVAASLLKVGIFSELFEADPSFSPILSFSVFPFFSLCETRVLVVLAIIPVYSRMGLGLLFYLPFARDSGLARTLGDARVFHDRFLLVFAYGLLSLWVIALLGLKGIVLPVVIGVFIYRYGLYCVETFGGITGDLMGAFVEMSEILALLTLVVMEG